ncbi:cell cycle control protein 50A-like [Sinocyclocheilus anshuiensis]|uniref:cell cycle control protein 50A-like n=1 Tax=Sinocyclocheilus anshuiensis TaxID=1608454 RepID=UPI0007BA28A8|nr:PREDICTED: cell cycle control protein 50A-like [Sinocyclocheilus anshuiensis]XP_016367223.1 PREDICTED: cell cycle control protein 50A-like [Sinocyclocheilus rhinocerous]
MMASSYNAKDEDHHPGSVGSGGPGAVKSKKPDNTAFKQQRLPAWQPILTAGTVLPAFFMIGLIFIPIGIGLLVTSNNIKEFESNVFMYYGLSNFYQNHRRYVKSRDDSQLNGDKSSLLNPSKECEPYRTSDKKPIAPCGAIANSLFNDTLELFYNHPNGSRITIHLVKTGIAWWTDKHVKFRNPAGNNNNLSIVFQDTSKPVNWHKPVYELDPSDPENNGFINEDFIVWMRTAALPTFRKLYRVIQKKKDNMTPTLPPGNYSLEVTYNYPVRSFDGRKRMILSTISWMGGKNPFLGIAYITVGSVCFFLGVVLLIIHHKYGNRNNNADIPN